MHRVERILDKITGILAISAISPAAVALVVWIGVMSVSIIGRALFDLNLLFVEEFTAYMEVVAGTLALCYALRKGAHIKVDVVTRLLPRRAQDVLEAITNLLSFVIVVYLVQKGVMWVLSGIETGVHSEFQSNIPQWPLYLLVPVGLIPLALNLFLELYRSVIRLLKGAEKETK